MKVLKNFIVIEGIDGAGTSTLLRNLIPVLKERGINPIETCEPSPLPTGKLIRSMLKKDFVAPPETLALLFAADRFNHLYNSEEGLEILCKKQPVVCDRYLFSSLAYQSIQCPWDWVHSLNADFPLPEKLIFIDLPAEIAQERVKNRDDELEIFDHLSIQQQVRKNYQRVLELYKNSPMEILVLNGHKSPKILTEMALSFLLP